MDDTLINGDKMMAEHENNIRCNYCGREIAPRMVGVRWDNGEPYSCCTMCCGVGKKVII